MRDSGYLQHSHPSSPRNDPPPLLIEGCALLTPGAQGNLLLNQDILIVGSRIQAVGPTGTVSLDPAGEGIVLQGKGLLAIPGLINAHTHSPENLLKATSPSLPLELWLVPLFAGLLEWSPRLVYLSAMLGATEMLKTGTTAVLDHIWTVAGVASEYLDAAMQAYVDVGIRAAVTPSIEDQDLVLEAGRQHGLQFPQHPFTDRFSSWPALDEQIAALERFLDTWHQAADGRLRCLVGPSGIHWCSPSLLQSCLQLAERYRTGIHLHVVETELQAVIIRNMLGQGGIAFLDHVGMLRPGTSLAHAIWLDPGDLERLVRTGAIVVHNPVSNLRLGSGRFPLVEARRLGVTVALGSDGSASNDTQNMFGVLKLTGLVHNGAGDLAVGTSSRPWSSEMQVISPETGMPGWKHQSSPPSDSGLTRQLMAVNPGSSPSPTPAVEWEKRGGILFAARDYAAAVQAYQRAVELEANNASTWLALGDAYFALDRYTEALQSYEKAVSLNPNDSVAWFNRGTTLDVLRRHREAEACFERARLLSAEEL